MHPSEAEPTPLTFIGRIARSGAWNVVAYVVDAGSALGISVLVGRALGPAVFGRYAYLMWIIRTVAVLGAIGLPAATTRMVSEFLGADDPARATGLYRTALRIHLVTTPLLFLVAGSFVWIKGGHDPVLAIALGLATVFLSLIYTMEQSLAGARRFPLVARIAFLVAIAQLFLVIVAIRVRADAKGFLLIQAAASAFALIVWLFVTGRVFVRPGRNVGRDVRRSFLKLSGMMAVIALSDSILWGRPELFFLERRSIREVGLYGAALVLATMTSSLPLIASRVLTPEFSWLRGGGREETLRDNFRSVCTSIGLVAIPLGIGGAIVAKDALIVLYGTRFASAAAAGTVLMAGAVFISVAGPASSATITGPNPGFMARLAASFAVINIGLDLVLVPRFGMVGAASATIASQVASIFILFSYVRRRLGLHHPYSSFIRIALASVTAAGLGRIVAQRVGAGPGLATLSVTVGVAVLIYPSMVLLLRVVRLSDLRSRLGRRPA